MSNTQSFVDSAACAAADSVSRSTPRLWFITEIQHMMHGFGDCRKPLPETAALVEEIVYRQMVDILYLAEDVRRQRNARFINIEEFLFLLRRDKIKLKRLLRYLDFKDLKAVAVKGVEDEDVESDARQPMKKRRKVCHEFLSIIDDTGELTALLDDTMDDEIKRQRKLRAEMMTRNMSEQQYLEFCEARQASFTPRYKTQKFKEWLLSSGTADIKLSPFAIEILSYLAYETVAQIVDLALIVKRDMNAVIDDPFSHEMAPVFCGLSALAAPPSEQTSNVSATGVNTALTSPPSSPGSNAESYPGSSVNVQSNSLSKPKPKRKKQVSQNLMTSNAITPNEVREALRRYTQPIGPFADFSKEPLLPVTHRRFAC